MRRMPQHPLQHPLQGAARSRRRAAAAFDAARLDALWTARDADAALAHRLATAARRALGPAALYALAPLAGMLAATARGLAPASGWDDALRDLAPPTAAASYSWDDLLARLLDAVPRGAHEERIERALEATVADPTAVPSLIMLVEGAVACGAVELERRLVDRVRGLAPHGLLTVVQAPLLRRIGAPEVRRLRPELLDALAPLPDATPYARGGARSLAATVAAFEASGLLADECVSAAAALARFGDQDGALHGCVLVGEAPADGGPMPLLGAGFNHIAPCDASSPPRRRVVHAEAHAAADAVSRHGHRRAAERLAGATAWVVELVGRTGYDDAHPCRACDPVLRAAGVGAVKHTTWHGHVETRGQAARQRPEVAPAPPNS
ncbi:hypothetical protein M885DRAFT_614479 [Pelagophyceae sp. CCMP2097]|nr:hypothetical protein M885DRAFT_614479 [Pelagophyceae sp. CCMP2097]